VGLGAITNGDAKEEVDGIYIYLHRRSNSFLAFSSMMGRTGLGLLKERVGHKGLTSNTRGSIPSIPCHPSGQNTDKAMSLRIKVITSGHAAIKSGFMLVIRRA
jgi:hypothetical protein